VQARAATGRSRFEQAVFMLTTYVAQEDITAPETFISYAWGDPEYARWVDQSLASDLVKAGVPVILDRWHNARTGDSVTRFVELAATADRVIVVGTPRYRTKYQNKEAMTPYTVAAEGDLIAARMVGTEEQKRSVLPILLAGSSHDSFPPLLAPRVHADFRQASAYFATMLKLLLDLYAIPADAALTAELRALVSGV
jgi:hypothetical protein